MFEVSELTLFGTRSKRRGSRELQQHNGNLKREMKRRRWSSSCTGPHTTVKIGRRMISFLLCTEEIFLLLLRGFVARVVTRLSGESKGTGRLERTNPTEQYPEAEEIQGRHRTR